MKIQGIGALVTGGGSGRGEAIARALTARRASMAILDPGHSQVASSARELGARPPELASLACEIIGNTKPNGFEGETRWP